MVRTSFDFLVLRYSVVSLYQYRPLRVTIRLFSMFFLQNPDSDLSDQLEAGFGPHSLGIIAVSEVRIFPLQWVRFIAILDMNILYAVFCL